MNERSILSGGEREKYQTRISEFQTLKVESLANRSASRILQRVLEYAPAFAVAMPAKNSFR